MKKLFTPALTLSTFFMLSVLMFAQPAQALVKIRLTDANADPMPIALTNFSGATSEENDLGKRMVGLISNNLKNTGLFNNISERAFLQSDDWILSFTKAIIISSETRLPASITFFAFRPISVPATTAARNMSPVDI